MGELSKEECKQVSGAGAFNFLKGAGFAAMGIGVGFVFGGPAGAVAGAMIYVASESSSTIYEMANEDRESKRVENYDYSK